MENVNRKDLMYVILIGIIVSTLTGMAVGTIDYLLYSSLGITLKLFYFVGTYFIASYIRRQYVESARLYQIIAVIVTMHGYFFSLVIFFVYINGIDTFEYLFKFVYSVDYMVSYFNPLNVFTGGMGYMLEYFFVFLFGYLAYTKTK